MDKQYTIKIHVVINCIDESGRDFYESYDEKDGESEYPDVLDTTDDTLKPDFLELDDALVLFDELELFVFSESGVSVLSEDLDSSDQL
ncbi:MAG: hypothetical protein EZS28_038157 [Streblomastix strix]|uniref:Uncharacterized protein n=1 Tax=Streblomastix strix TaxID=222440 RepID=A0A5J4U649_9EUKA|nr:MAG: hypothetical protein EZS28_038157 [Streblomastix strix]